GHLPNHPPPAWRSGLGGRQTGTVRSPPFRGKYARQRAAGASLFRQNKEINREFLEISDRYWSRWGPSPGPANNSRLYRRGAARVATPREARSDPWSSSRRQP